MPAAVSIAAGPEGRAKAAALLAQSPVVGLATWAPPEALRAELLALAGTGEAVVVLDLATTPDLAELMATPRAVAALDGRRQARALLAADCPLPRRWAALEITDGLLQRGVGQRTEAAALAAWAQLPPPPPPVDVGQLAENARFCLAVAQAQAQAIRAAGLVGVSRLEAQVVAPLARLEEAGLPFAANRWERRLAEERQEGRQLRAALGARGLSAEVLRAAPAALLAAVRATGLQVDDLRGPTLAACDPAGLGPLLARYLHLRRLQHAWGARFLQQANGGDGRVRGHFVQLGAHTGRIVCQRPNLQAVPKDDGRRACFRPGPDSRLLELDYAACELRILAQMSRDPAYLAAFARGEDVHAQIARSVFHVHVDRDQRPELREAAKVISFGLIYGMQAAGLAARLRCGAAEAEALVTRFFATYPHLRQFLADSEATALRRGYAESLLGRRLELAAAASGRDQGYRRRLARNMPIQGTGADLMKKALVAVDGRLARKHPSARVVHCVHDALLVECAATDAAAVAECVQAQMLQAAIDLLPDVPAAVDVAIGEAWG